MSSIVELDNNRLATSATTAIEGDAYNQARHESSLPPTDRGKDAWLFLAACWAVEALVWGFGFSFGVFQDYYSSHLPFKGSGEIAVVGTTTLVSFYCHPFHQLYISQLDEQATKL
ncbi:hypothetical protein VTI74DRAFT_2052 [Chaetomium olivicolor]